MTVVKKVASRKQISQALRDKDRRADQGGMASYRANLTPQQRDEVRSVNQQWIESQKANLTKDKRKDGRRALQVRMA